MTKYWIQSFSGKVVEPLALKPEQVDIESIAHALAAKCRYTGHCLKFYSVAEHCVKGAEVFEKQGRRDLALSFLFHDAGEAYLCDVAGPIKQFFRIEMPNHGGLVTFDELEGWVLRMIARGLLLIDAAPFDNPEIKNMDLGMLLAEKAQVCGLEPEPWGLPGVSMPDVKIEGWLPEVGEKKYLEIYNRLRTVPVMKKTQPAPALKRGRK